MPHSSPSVLVIRLDAIGDALALTPLLAALRERSIPVDLVLCRVNAEVFSSRAARRRYVAPFAVRSSTRENLAAIAAFGDELRAAAYTHVLVATEDPGGYRLARAIGAPQRAGFVNGWGKPLKTLWAASYLTRSIVRSAGLDPRAPHECEVLWKLGDGLTGEMAIPRDPAVLRPLVIENGAERGAEIVFQVTDKWERLGIAFGDVTRALRLVAAAYPVRAIAAESESPYAARIAAAAGMDVARYSGLEPWKHAIAQARALIAPDSGAVHVAGMTGTPVIALFPPIQTFALQSARWAPWAAPYRALVAGSDWPAAALAAVRELLER